MIPYADAARARGLEVFHLNIGQPDIETPPEAMDAIRNVDLEVLGYAPSQGFPEYRQAWADYYGSVGVRVDAEEVLVTTGGSEALVFALGTLLDPGDEILIPEPMYANYLGFAALLGVRVVPITCRVEDGYRLPPRSTIDALVTSRTRAVLLCNPGNPTGVVYSEVDIERVIDVVRSHDLWLVADEVYREFVYEGGTARSLLTFPEVSERVVVVDSISKRYSACGARIGCLVTRNGEVRDAALRYAQARLSPPTLGQVLGQAAAGLPKDYIPSIVDEYAARRELVFEAVTRMPGTVCLKPGGAFYLMARLPVDDAETFIIWLLESFSVDGATTLMAPGEGFYVTPGAGLDEVRIAYVLNLSDLAHAMRVVEEGLSQYPGRRLPDR